MPAMDAATEPRRQLADDAEEVALLGSIADGDQAAFAVLFDRYGASVLGFLTRLLGDRGEAEEVLQEAFFQVWEQADRYRPERASPRSWIYLLARSRALDRLRARSSRQRRESEEAIGGVGLHAAAAEPAAAVESRVDASRLLAVLHEDQRQCVELSFFQGLSLSQIAERLEVPLGTVKSRYLYGMRKLRTAWAERS
jgi:RNA polymerase sigma-70 factor (ECF subfamily)